MNEQEIERILEENKMALDKFYKTVDKVEERLNMNNKPKTYFFVTNKEGVTYMQTYNSYLAKALAFIGHHYYAFDTEIGKVYSFEDSDELFSDLAMIMKMRKENLEEKKRSLPRE